MPTFKVEIPVKLSINISAPDEGKALLWIERAFEHNEPLGSSCYVNLILRRGEDGIARVVDAEPTNEALLYPSKTEASA